MLFDEYDVVKTEEYKLGRFRIVLDQVNHDGKEYPYSFIDVKDSVAVLAKVEDKFVFIQQYRHTIKKIELEIPGGAIEEGETPKQAAMRELSEETGYYADRIELLGLFYPTIGISNEKCFLYYAECSKTKTVKHDPLEKISTSLLNAKDISDLMNSGRIRHSMALVAWLKYKMREENAYKNHRTKFYKC